VVAEAGAPDERHRLIAIYQGIVLSAARRALPSVITGDIDHLVSRYAQGVVILRPLRDEYYMVVSLHPGADVPMGVRRSAAAQAQMNEAI